jgi:hypothetical protein
MSTKDYRLIAATIKEIRDEFVRAYVARAFCKTLAAAHPPNGYAFKPGVFMKACGVEA